MFLPHDLPLLFSNYCTTLGFPKFSCCNKVPCRTRVQELLCSQVTKVSLTFLLVPAAPGLVACRWSIWPLIRAHMLPYELSFHLDLVAGSHGAQFPQGTEKRQLVAMLQGWAGPQMFVKSGLALGIIHSCGHGRPIIIKVQLLLLAILKFNTPNFILLLGQFESNTVWWKDERTDGLCLHATKANFSRKLRKNPPDYVIHKF